MVATKEQERQAVKKIQKIIEGLGEDSYLAITLNGVWDMVEGNIEDDSGNSVQDLKDRLAGIDNENYEYRNKVLKEAAGDVAKAQAQLVDQMNKSAVVANDNYNLRIKAATSGDIATYYKAENEKLKAQYDEYIQMLADGQHEIERLTAQVTALKVALYDLEHA